MNRFEEIKEKLAEINPEALLADGYEEALIGIARQFNTFCACYDYDKCIDILMKRDGMDYDEASEFFEFNTVGAFAGPYTPVFMDRCE